MAKLLQLIGPFELSRNGDKLFLREYRWNRLANILYIESPAGVGFSYSDSKNYVHSDESSAQDNYDAIQSFFTLFPEYNNNKLYITGESYAGKKDLQTSLLKDYNECLTAIFKGIYVPMLSWYILQHEEAGTYQGPKLSGIAVGNGCVGAAVGVCSSYFTQKCQGQYFLYKYLDGLSFFVDELKVAIDNECDWKSCQSPTASINVLSKTCSILLDVGAYMLGDYINVYNVYGRCEENACAGPDDTQNSNRRARVGRKYNSVTESIKEYEKSIHGATTIIEKGIPKFERQADLNHNVYDGRYNHLFDEKMLKYIYSKLELSLELEMKENHGNKDNSGEIHVDLEYAVHTTDDDANSAHYDSYYSPQGGPSGCMNSYAATTYLMTPEVQKAIHVKPINFCWGICNSAHGFDYKITAQNLPRDVYPVLVSKLKVLIFNGDWDACVPYTGKIVFTS